MIAVSRNHARVSRRHDRSGDLAGLCLRLLLSEDRLTRSRQIFPDRRSPPRAGKRWRRPAPFPGFPDGGRHSRQAARPVRLDAAEPGYAAAARRCRFRSRSRCRSSASSRSLTAFRARRMAMALTDSEQEAVAAARTDSLTGLMNRPGFNRADRSAERRATARRSARDHLSRHQRLQGGERLDRPPRRRRAGQGARRPHQFACFRRTPRLPASAATSSPSLLIGKNVRDMAPRRGGGARPFARPARSPSAASSSTSPPRSATPCAEHGRQRRARLSAAPTLPCIRPRTAPSASRSPTTRPWRPARSRRSRSRRRCATRSKQNELKVFYQPVVRASDLDDRRLRGAGALDRRRSSARSRRRSSSRSPKRPASSTTSAASSSTAPARTCTAGPASHGRSTSRRCSSATRISPTRSRRSSSATAISPHTLRARADRRHPRQQPDDRQAQARTC